ncbi:MAG: DUF3467 domain-containing protein [Acidobacteriota bacterium]
MEKDKKPQVKGMRLKISDPIMRGTYANSMMVSHTKEEFILDFINAFPPEATVNARIITSPGHLKRLVGTLQQNLAKYESKFGPIQEASTPGAQKNDDYVM